MARPYYGRARGNVLLAPILRYRSLVDDGAACVAQRPLSKRVVNDQPDPLLNASLRQGVLVAFACEMQDGRHDVINCGSPTIEKNISPVLVCGHQSFGKPPPKRMDIFEIKMPVSNFGIGKIEYGDKSPRRKSRSDPDFAAGSARA